MEFAEHPRKRTLLPSARTLSVLALATLVAAGSGWVWLRRDITKNPIDFAISMTKSPDADDRRNAAVLILRSVRRQIDSLRSMRDAGLAEDSTTQATAALRDIAEYATR
jgi:hypothetical protein